MLSKSERLFMRVTGFWPVAHVFATIGIFTKLCHEFSWAVSVTVGIFLIYCLPPLLCRSVLIFFKVGLCQTGDSSRPREFLAWWLTSLLQTIFVRFSFFEEFLRVFPGLYSFWLRCWGSQVGWGVSWGPGVRILDRAILKVGDDVIIGYGVTITGHLLSKTDHSLMDFVSGSVTIGDRALLGGMCMLAPGSAVGADEMLPGFTRLAPHYHWKGNRKQLSKNRNEGE